MLDGSRAASAASCRTVPYRPFDGCEISSQVGHTTKLWISDFGYEQAPIGVEGCLRRLGLDYVDLFLLHHPVPSDFDGT